MKIYFYRRKAYTTLLETLIAISLLSVVLTFVFGFFRELSQLSFVTEQAEKETFRMRYLESRLNFIFERIVNENSSSREFYFYTQSSHSEFTDFPTLIFTFFNGVRLNPRFSGDILARLYIDSTHRLCLAMWPLFVSEPHHHLQEEVLLSDVMNIRYSFYSAPEKTQQATDLHSGKQIDPEKKTPEKDHWYENEWLFSYDQMPSMIKIMIEVAKHPEDLKKWRQGMQIETKNLDFMFVLPSSNHPVHYPPD